MTGSPMMIARAAWGLPLAAVFLAAARYLSGVDVFGEDLELSGTGLIAYHVARAVVTCGMTVGILSIGAFLLRLLQRRFAGRLNRSEWTVASFLLGAVAVGISASLLGRLHWLSAEVFQIFFTLFIAAAPWAVAGRPRPAAEDHRLFVGILGTVAGGVYLLLFLHRVCLPPRFDSDVWGHYLPYYQNVLVVGGTGPNDVWLHYFHSKHAGVQLAALFLTDLSGTCIASFVFVLISTATIFDLTKTWLRDLRWAWVAALLFPLYLLHDDHAIPSFAKHHYALTALLCGVVWSLSKSAQAAAAGRSVRAFVCVGACCAFYGAFYISQFAAVLAAVSVAGAIGAVLTARRFRRALPGVCTATAAMSGCLIALGGNYLATGLPEMAPSRLFWRLADRSRFSGHWSPYVMEVFFCDAEATGKRGLADFGAGNGLPSWLGRIIRWNYFEDFVPAVAAICLLALAAGLATRRLPWTTISKHKRLFRKSGGRMVRGFLVFAAALAVGFAFAGAPSIERMFVFAGVFMILLWMLLLRLLVGPLRRRSPAWTLCAAAMVLFMPMKGLARSGLLDAPRYLAGEISTAGMLTKIHRDWDCLLLLRTIKPSRNNPATREYCCSVTNQARDASPAGRLSFPSRPSRSDDSITRCCLNRRRRRSRSIADKASNASPSIYRGSCLSGFRSLRCLKATDWKNGSSSNIRWRISTSCVREGRAKPRRCRNASFPSWNSNKSRKQRSFFRRSLKNKSPN